MNNQCFVDIRLLTSRDSNQFSLIGTSNQQHHHENKEDNKKDTANNRGIMLSSAEKQGKEGGRGKKGNHYNVCCAGSSSSFSPLLSLDPPLPFPSCLRIGFSLSPPSTGTLPSVCNLCKMNLHKARIRTRFDCRVRLKHTAAPWKPLFMCITIDESCLDSNGRLLQNGTSFIAHQEQAAPITTFVINPNPPSVPTSRKDGQTSATSSSITSVVHLLSSNDNYDAEDMTMLSDTKCMDCCKRHYTTKRCRKILKHRALPHFTSYHRMTVATSTIKHNENESGPLSSTPPPPPALKEGRTTNSITIPTSSSFVPTSSSVTEEQKVFLRTGVQKEKCLPSGVIGHHEEKNEEQRQNDDLNYHFRRPRDYLRPFFDTEVPESRTFVVRVVSTESSTFEVNKKNSENEQSICHAIQTISFLFYIVILIYDF